MVRPISYATAQHAYHRCKIRDEYSQGWAIYNGSVTHEGTATKVQTEMGQVIRS